MGKVLERGNQSSERRTPELPGKFEQQLALVLLTAEIRRPCLAPLPLHQLGGIAGSGICQRGSPVRPARRFGNVQAGFLVIGGVLETYLDPAQPVHQLDEALEVDPHVVVDFYTGELLDGQGQEFRSVGPPGASAQVGVDPPVIVGAEVVQVEIARDRDQGRRRATFGKQCQDDAVGQVAARVGAYKHDCVEHPVG